MFACDDKGKWNFYIRIVMFVVVSFVGHES